MVVAFVSPGIAIISRPTEREHLGEIVRGCVLTFAPICADSWAVPISAKFWHTQKGAIFSNQGGAILSHDAAFACKYVAGAKVLVSESGGWHTQTPGSDSPLNDLPKSRVSFTAKTPSDAELAPIALEAERLRDLASEEGHWSRSFRQALGDFYRYVKKHGTPEGQPESTFAIAKGNYDLEGGTQS